MYTSWLRWRTKEMIVGTLLVSVLAVLSLPMLARSREASRRSSCQNNLKQLGIVLKMYAGEHKGSFPPLSPIPDNWLMDMHAVYPEYLTDSNILICPDSPFSAAHSFQSQSSGAGNPDCVSSLFYIYTGFAIFCDEQALALFAEYGDRRQELVESTSLDLQVPDWSGSDRTRFPGVAGMPVIWDRVPLREDEFAHTPSGINVLHQDGHVEFVKYSAYNNSNFFPATRASAETFGSVLPDLPAKCLGY